MGFRNRDRQEKGRGTWALEAEKKEMGRGTWSLETETQKRKENRHGP